MSIPAPQRDAIEEVLSKAGRQDDPSSNWILHLTITTDRGEILHLLGVNPGTNLRPPAWRDFNVAVYRTTPPEGELQLPEDLIPGDETTVNAAVLVEPPQEPRACNELRVELLDRIETDVKRTGISENYCATI